MAIDEIVKNGSIIFSEDNHHYALIKVILDSPLPGRALQKLARRYILTLRDDFEQYLRDEAFAVGHSLIGSGLFDIDAYHQAIEGGLHYSLDLAHHTVIDRAVPSFNITTCKNKLPRKVGDASITKLHDSLVRLHNKHLQAYDKRLRVEI